MNFLQGLSNIHRKYRILKNKYKHHVSFIDAIEQTEQQEVVNFSKKYRAWKLN